MLHLRFGPNAPTMGPVTFGSDLSRTLSEGSGAPLRSVLLASFAGAVVASVVLGAFSWGRYVIYPFSLFATWAHEMGHGLGAIITGNRFIELEIYPSLGGQALTSGADGLAQVIVSMLGLVGPALVGAAVMIAGSSSRGAPRVVGALAVVVALSTLIWVRNGFGFGAMLLVAVGLGLVARFGSPLVRIVFAQLLAIQMAMATWSGRHYLFVKGFERDGFQASDTQRIAEELWLPYWFWGAIAAVLSIAALGLAFKRAWLSSPPAPESRHAPQAQP